MKAFPETAVCVSLEQKADKGGYPSRAHRGQPDAVQSQKTGKDEKEQNRKHQSLSGGRYKGEDGAVQCSKKGTG